MKPKKNKSKKKQAKRTGKTSKPMEDKNNKAELTRTRKYYLEGAEIQSREWEKVKAEIKSRNKQIIETSKLEEKTKIPFRKETFRRQANEEHLIVQHLWDHPSRYLDLTLRIRVGLKTGLSPDDRLTVLAALGHGGRVESERKNRKSFSDKFQQVKDEVDQWRVAYFEGGAKNTPKRMTALVKKLGLTGYNYAPTYSKVDLVKACYQILSNTGSVDSQAVDDLEYLCGGREKFEKLFLPLPPDIRLFPAESLLEIKRNADNETMVILGEIWCKIKRNANKEMVDKINSLLKKIRYGIRRKAIEKTRKIINEIIGKKTIDIGFRIKNEYACYQFLRKECGLKGLPKPPLSPIE